MKISILKFCFVIVVLAVFFTACKKSDDENDAASSFTWTWDGNNYTGNFREAYIESRGQFPTIIGGTNSSTLSPGSGPTLIIPSLNEGAYSFGATNNNNLYFISTNGDLHQAINGTLNITRNSNNKLSGDFTATLVGVAGQTSLSGAFVNIRINP